MFNSRRMDEMVKENAIQKATDDVRCWLAHAITASVGVVLVQRQMLEGGVFGETSDYFMDELGRFRKEVANVVYDWDAPMLRKLYCEDPDLSLLTKPEWFCDLDWENFLEMVGPMIVLYAKTTTEITDLKMGKMYDLLKRMRQ